MARQYCTAEGCEEKRHGKGLCGKHYTRIRRAACQKERDGYGSWLNMKKRCSSPEATAYDYYGGRGIKVCDRWNHSFTAFIEDMGPRPDKSYSIDRIDGEGNYEPSNCRWASRTTQAVNQRMNKRNTSGVTGVSYCKDRGKWEAYIKIHYKRIRLGRYSDFDAAVSARKAAEIKYHGEYK